MSESKAASVVFTNSSYLAGQAQDSAEDAQRLADNAKQLAIGAQTTADGKNKIYRGSSLEDAPRSGVIAGDLFFSSNELYRYDGTNWEEVVSDTTGEETHAEIEKATNEAKSYSDSAKAQIEADAATAKATAEQITNYVQNSSGSSYLATLLKQSASNASLSALVNGQVVSAINLSSSGDTLIAGKKILLDGDVTIDGTAFASKIKATGITVDQLVAGSIDASKINVINLTADKIASGTLNGMTITGSKFVANTDNGNLFGTLWKNYQVVVENTGLNIHGKTSPDNDDVEAILTSDGLYLQMVTDDNKHTGSIDINNVGGVPYIKLINSGPGAGQYASTYIDTNGITSNQIQTNYAMIGPFHISYHHFRSDSVSLYLSNYNDSNFDSNGSIGFQVVNGIGLGKSTIYTPGTDLYIQKGTSNLENDMNCPYSRGAKVQIHCQNVASQVSNTVVSRLSVKTDIAPVSYDRALAAVEGTDMYDYRYINDDSDQHYVSGIIDDVNPDPQYHMDEMLINKERTARIDANLLGYHHVVLQKLLERVDALEHQINKA